MTIFVSLGPSLSRDEARKIVPAAEFIPPVKAGDILALMDRNPAVIAIIDGVFEQVPSVWHKEILYALSRGVHVWGASSMGALRAAELHTFGMRGIGDVFERYRDGEYTADDEVALLHGPASVGYAPRSEALVNLRAGLRQAEAAAVISADLHATLLQHARERFYPDRSWRQLIADGHAAGANESELTALDAFVSRTKPNVKRDDAVALLELLAAEKADRLGAHDPTFEFERTIYVDAMHERIAATRRASAHGADPAAASRLLEHARLTGPVRIDAANPVLLALLLDLLYAEAARSGVVVDVPANGEGEAAEIERARRVAMQLVGTRARSVSEFLPFVLQASGKLSSAMESADRKREWVRERGADAVDAAVENVTEAELLAFCRERLGIDDQTVAQCCTRLGFSNPADFARAVALQIAFERATA